MFFGIPADDFTLLSGKPKGAKESIYESPYGSDFPRSAW
jgi:hypothetical protein